MLLASERRSREKEVERHRSSWMSFLVSEKREATALDKRREVGAGAEDDCTREGK